MDKKAEVKAHVLRLCSRDPSQELGANIEKAIDDVIDLLWIALPRAMATERASEALALAFPQGFIPEYDPHEPDSGIVAVSIVPYAPSQEPARLCELLLDAECDDEQALFARMTLCAWIDGHYLSGMPIPDWPIARAVTQSVASWRLNGIRTEPPRKRPKTTEGRDALLRAAVSIAERHGLTPDKNQATGNKVLSGSELVGFVVGCIAAAIKLDGRIVTNDKLIAEIARSADRVRY